MILYGIYKKMCGGGNGNENNQPKKPTHNPHTGPSPVDLALMASGSGALAARARAMQQQQDYSHANIATPPALRPRGKYEMMEEQMRGMSNAQVASSMNTHSPIIHSPQPHVGNFGNLGSPPTVSPGARFIGSELQQLSPRQAPMELGLARRGSAAWAPKDDIDFDL